MVEKVYPQRALRAQEILSAAALELAEFGIAAFRPRKVAERLGVSNGSFIITSLPKTNWYRPRSRAKRNANSMS